MKTVILVCGLALLLVEHVTLAATLVFHEAYNRFTVPEGRLAIPCLQLIGSGSVEDFQKSQGLHVDGIVGPQTWAALFSHLKDREITLLPGADHPKLVRLELTFQANEMKLAVVNLTSEPLSMRSFNSASIVLPVAVKFSATRQGKQYSGCASLQFCGEPTTIPSGKTLELRATVEKIGPGSTELRVAVPAVLNERTVCMLTAPPVRLDGELRFRL